ncbi:MAG: hypothetical protein IT307_19175 [Chloroflexi bacterium]|nr:hypothetical protein [Chloroflexota bacterium]
MAVKPSTLSTQEIDHFLSQSRQILASATFSPPHGLGILASPPGGTYPYVHTRELAVVITTLTELSDFQAARPYCRFLLAIQSPTGSWAARYDSDGAEVPGQLEPDATAMALWALMNYVRGSGDDPLADQIRESVEEAVGFIRSRTLNPYLYLVETPISGQGDQGSGGYDLWNNCAHAAAFALCHKVYGGERYRRLALLIRRAIGQNVTSEGRFLRRLDPRGYPDPRSDVTQIAPYYFGLWAPSERMVMNSADQIERTLWNVEIGGYIRQLPYSRAERHGLPGPSPYLTAWMAQYHYDLGNKDRAEAIMRWLLDNTDDGKLAETLVPLASAQRFAAEQRRALQDPAAMRNLTEVQRERLLADLDRAAGLIEEHEVIPCGMPYVWSHVETLRALRKGGYLDNWELGSSIGLGAKD